MACRQRSSPPPPWLAGVAGALAGSASLGITYPLYTAVVRTQSMQKRDTSSSSSTSPTSSASSASSASSTSTSAILSRLSYSEWYDGLAAAMWASTAQSGIYYYWYNVFSRIHLALLQRRNHYRHRHRHRRLSPLSCLLVGFEAGCLTVLITNPLWLINTRMMLHRCMDDKDDKDGTGSCHRDRGRRSSNSSNNSNRSSRSNSSIVMTICRVWHDDGIRGFWAGTIPALALCINPALLFFSYEWLLGMVRWLLRYKWWLMNRSTSTSSSSSAAQAAAAAPNALTVFVCGGLAKIISTLVTYPLQIIKLQQQKQENQYKNKHASGAEAGEECDDDDDDEDDDRRRHHHHDIATLFSGVRIKLLQTSSKNACEFLLRDWCMMILHRWWLMMK